MASIYQKCLLVIFATGLSVVNAQIPEDDLVPSQNKFIWAAIGDSWTVSERAQQT